MNSLGKRISSRREELKMSVEELANKMNVETKVISKWEKGFGKPDFELLPSLAEVLDTTTDYLLTGKAPEVKIINMSSLEMCCKNDDVDAFNKGVAYRDDKNTFIEYVKLYNSKNVFKAFLEKENYLSGEFCVNRCNNLSRKEFTLNDLYSFCLKFDMFEELKKIGALAPMRKNGSITSGVLDQTLYSYDYPTIFYKNWPSKRIVDYYLSFVEAENIGRLSGSYLWHFPTDIDYGYTYNKLLSLAVKDKDVEKVKTIWKYINRFNEIIFEDIDKYNKDCQYGKIVPTYRYDSSDYHELSRPKYVAVSYEEAFAMLEMGLVEEAREANKYIADRGYNRKTIEENQFKKYQAIKDKSSIDTRIYDVMIDDILVINRLKEQNDNEFIVNMLKNYPISYIELIHEFIKAKNYRGLFEKMVDLGCGVDGKMLYSSELDKEREAYLLIGRYIIDANNRNGYSNSTYQKMHDCDCNNFNYNNRDNGCRSISDAIDRIKEPIKEDDENLEWHKQLYKNAIKVIDDYVDSIRDYKKSIIDTYQAKIDLEKLYKTNNGKEYFYNEIKKGHRKNAIIDLCVYFETKLKSEGKTGDFSEMMNKYCEKFWKDDDEGYNYCTDPDLVEVLNRLRIERNNYVHADKTDIKPLSNEELLMCVDEIVDE